MYGLEHMVHGWLSKLRSFLGVHIKGGIDIDVDMESKNMVPFCVLSTIRQPGI